MTVGCVFTLRKLDLSESNFVSLPACLAKFIKLDELFLKGCKRLQEVSELPPCLKLLDVGGCVSLEKISKLSNFLTFFFIDGAQRLSNILKHQKLQMFELLDLTNCWRLCHNLVQEAEKRGLLVNDNNHHVKADLFSLLLSSQKSPFSVLFPGSPEFLKWFPCQEDFKGSRPFEFHIQVLGNFTWQNTGLALCVACNEFIYWDFKIRINEEIMWSEFGTPSELNGAYYTGGARIWLHYIPFNRMSSTRSSGYRRPLPPFECRVTIYETRISRNHVPLKINCGIYLVMPPNEECMKLCHAQNFTDRLEAEN
ncbi:disease resistance-like protein CSA1 [Rosa rugosa]|uniref:disease resistance-like protein CSA1 n=1 Tax=Rosa rugosa TaxID=74645 RepID=UPI002B410F63|nr:disease resistance-like protein CSA1 [Rosa rugosa]